MNGRLPGCTYLDRIAGGMADPFWGENEKDASEAARQDVEYSRCFTLPPGFSDAACTDLVVSGLDTLCVVKINGKVLAETDNINRLWRFNVKDFFVEGENNISLYFKNPYAYMDEKHVLEPLTAAGNSVKGLNHLRKTPCHFGWDWGPVLPPAGVADKIGFESYDVRIHPLRVRQQHENGKVTLSLSAALTGLAEAACRAEVCITDADGDAAFYPAQLTSPAEDTPGRIECEAVIEKPRLWWCNGLGGHPLYTVELRLFDGQDQASAVETRRIGLRTLTLDTAPDEWGGQFRFVINSVPIFAKGANWIPPDSFITRRTRKSLHFYIEAAKRAHMNMLRVWGGGMYECDDFYDLCDENGILVWQDFIFACGAYPLYDQAFLDNVREEVRDNVRRIRHHASLALWCGNNENEIMRFMWKKNRKVDESNTCFYHETLRGWVLEDDEVTAYWPGSPSSGSPKRRVHRMKKGEIYGDSHLWQIWHGMKPIEAFRDYPTRFCSEFGMESMPSMPTVRSFTDRENLTWSDPVMQAHQKSNGGNEKIMFYLLAKYRRPASFEDLIYLSQLVQADTVRFATECWRRNIGRQNGALYWQYNDCWPVASWAGIDYGKQFKAVQYHARHFNRPLCLSNDYFNHRAELYVINEYPEAFAGRLEWRLCTFDGREVASGTETTGTGPVSASRVTVLRFANILHKHHKNTVVLYAKLFSNEKLLDEKNWLLVPDRKAKLPKPAIMAAFRAGERGEVEVTLRSAVFARYVYLEAEGVSLYSDNFFDIPGGGEKKIVAMLPEGMRVEDFRKRLKVRSLADVKPYGSRLTDRLTRFSMYFRKANFFSWLIFKFI